MNLWILYLGLVIASVRKSCKTSTIKIDSKGWIARNKSIQPNIKFFAPNKQWIIDIPLYDIGLCWIVLPLCNLVEFIEQKYSFSLRPTSRFHYPYIALLWVLYSFELISKNEVFAREDIGLRVKCITELWVLYLFASAVLPYF